MNLPPYTTYPQISNQRVALRQIQSVDVPALFAISYYNAVQAATIEEAQAMHVEIERNYLNGTLIHWCIVDKQTDTIVGTCGYYRGFEGGQGEIGCVLLPQFRGKGFMTIALSLAIDFGIRVIGLKRIWAETDQQNSAAIQLLERLNFMRVANSTDSGIEYELRK